MLAAIATEGVKDVACKTLRVDTYQWRLGMDVAHNERDGRFFAALAGGFEVPLKSEDAEMSPASGEVGLSHFPDG